MIAQDETNRDFLKKYKGINRKMEEEAAAAKAVSLGYQYINLEKFPVDLNALGMLTLDQSEDAESGLFYKDGYDLRIGTVNPSNEILKKLILEFETRRLRPQVYLISNSSLRQLLAMFDKAPKSRELAADVIKISKNSNYVGSLKDLAVVYEKPKTATEIVEVLLGAAYQYGASDIHIEPELSFVKIRYRLDGVLYDMVHLPKIYQKSLGSRIKILARLKLNVENVSQDGRFTFAFDGNNADVRVAVLPGNNGETFVLRILGRSEISLRFDQLGFAGDSLQQIENELAKPNGMILTTGPTGSGKTTTLYTFLSRLNEPGVKIITLEDPVEYKLSGIVQTPITPGFSFAPALRAILRQDPDVVMIGEIRDAETAETAMQAALTGHIVFSTLHTNDAAGAIPRLLNMGVKPFVLAPAVNAIIAQRLVRKLCEFCKQEIGLEPATLSRVKKIIDSMPKSANIKIPKALKFFHSPGCKQCNNIGYKGRIGIFEVIVKDPGLEKMILAGVSPIEIKDYAVSKGMITMIQDGILKALAGITDVEEVFRVTLE